MKRIFFTVTNDLVYDQRMNRICSSLAKNGFAVTLVGRRTKTSPALKEEPYHQHRLNCWLTKGKFFYLEYNIRLLFFLLFQKIDILCAIDLDSIVPGYFVSVLKRIPRLYDAHELFTELKEVATRPSIQKIWLFVERKMLPRFPLGYTVSDGIAAEFKHRYQVNYKTIRNISRLREIVHPQLQEKTLLYQGAVNEARAFEYLIPALKQVPYKLIVCGDGNFMPQLKQLIKENKLEDKVELKGMIPPDDLWQIAQQCHVGIAVAENIGLNQYLALPNKFFDYIHAGLPQITMRYPEYENINAKYEVAVLIDDLEPKKIADAINNLLNNSVLYNNLRQNCLKAREELNWEKEETKLLDFYTQISKNNIKSST